MIKKIFLIIIFSSLLSSCGMKGDPRIESDDPDIIKKED